MLNVLGIMQKWQLHRSPCDVLCIFCFICLSADRSVRSYYVGSVGLVICISFSLFFLCHANCEHNIAVDCVYCASVLIPVCPWLIYECVHVGQTDQAQSKHIVVGASATAVINNTLTSLDTILCGANNRIQNDPKRQLKTFLVLDLHNSFHFCGTQLTLSLFLSLPVRVYLLSGGNCDRLFVCSVKDLLQPTKTEDFMVPLPRTSCGGHQVQMWPHTLDDLNHNLRIRRPQMFRCQRTSSRIDATNANATTIYAPTIASNRPIFDCRSQTEDT